jgi:hypothetical protein
MTQSNLPTLAESQGDICYSDEDYDKPYTARPVENLPSQLRLIRATLTNQICEAYDDGDYALQNTLTVIRSSIDALSDELQGL